MAEKLQLKGLGQKEVDAFFNLINTRHEKIAEAPATPLQTKFPVNELMRKLHPISQALEVCEIIEHTPDVKTYVFKRTDGEPAYFRAGQYLSLVIPVANVTVTRPYSICSTPSETKNGIYKITVKRVDDGFISPFILDNWTVGTQITSSGPLGRFYYEPMRDAKTVIGVAGGSGITPFLSLAGAIRDGVEDANLILLYGSRTESDILFRDEFKAIEQACPKVKVVHVLSDSTSGDPTDGIEHGFITAELIQKYAPTDEPYSVFLCGPQQMYNFVDGELQKLGIIRKYIRHELFGEIKNPQNIPGYPEDHANQTYRMTVRNLGETTQVDCNANESILVALERAGIATPAHCRSGECGFCRSRLVTGDVFIPSDIEGRRLADIALGFIHPCCSYPLSDLEIIAPPR
ncbi:MAG: iron-sulfur cluster-binding domain-containing protein [Clostridiales Family XIII bacterium]|jgi:ferredoxin-NADP reductase|nr:iron-sulfur cluster-binding domain-containing protein [Clostridiales Family XIII bacterium]